MVTDWSIFFVLLYAEKYVAHVSPLSRETEKVPRNDENGFLWENNEAVSNEGLEEKALKENIPEL